MDIFFIMKCPKTSMQMSVVKRGITVQGKDDKSGKKDGWIRDVQIFLCPMQETCNHDQKQKDFSKICAKTKNLCKTKNRR